MTIKMTSKIFLKRIIKATLLGGLAISVLSCKDKVEGQIELTISPSNVIVINTSRLSCSQIATGDVTTPGVGAPSFQLNSLSYTWKGNNDAVILYMKLTVQSGFAGAEQELIIGGDDLNAMLCGVPPGSLCPKAFIPGGDAVARVASCSPRMSITFNDNDAPAFGSGTLEVYGVEKDGDEDRPIRGETNFTFEYN